MAIPGAYGYAAAIGARDRSRSPMGGMGGDPQMEEIVNAIVQREHARKAKDFRLADEYRTQLSSLGVTLFDKTNSWKDSSGRSGRIPTFNELEAGETPETLLATAGATFLDDTSEANIRALIQAREQARAAKDFPQSDKIRDDLRAMGVEVFDKEKMWKASSGAQGCIIGFRADMGPTDVEITALVAQREKARQSGDWATADLIRTELKQAGCDVDDKQKNWRTADGRFGMVPAWTNTPGGGGAAVGAGMAHHPYPAASAANNIQTQLLQAALAAAQNPATAARTLQVLQQAAGGGAGLGAIGSLAAAAQHRKPPMPAASMGRASGNPEVQTAMATMHEIKATGRFASDAEIMYVIGVREKLRQDKDYAAADQMRDALRSNLSIELHEKEKRWSTSDGRQGEIPKWDQL